MSEKRHESGAQKRKKREENVSKLNEQLKKTPKLFELGFTRKSLNQNIHDTLHNTPSTEEQESTTSNCISVDKNGNEGHKIAENQNENSIVVEEDQNDNEVHITHINRKNLGAEYLNDIGLWKNVTHEVQEYWCSLGNFNECQHFENDFSASIRHYEDGKSRHLTKSMFFRSHISGENIKREWMMYSPSSGNIYCAPCVLFGGSQTKSQFQSGFSDWKNASQRIKAHENGEAHRTSVQTLIKRRLIQGRIDSSFEIQFNKERTYWIKVCQRIVSVIKFMSSRGLAFRGQNEILGSQHNGNYLGILELMAQYDPFLGSHIAKYGNQGKGKNSYLSSTICEEIIAIMGDQVVNNIVKDVIEAKYFSLSVDSTPDITHTDQLTLILRYVMCSNGEVMERFLTFIPIESHTGEDIANIILSKLKKLNIDIKYLRSQSYDNAANMSGCYKGLQAHIKNINPLAHYAPCAAHSLNLVGLRAAESCVEAISFFGFLQKLYNFFSGSTHRWGVLLKYLTEDAKNKSYSPLVLKKQSDTRWSARADATKALSNGHDGIQAALNVLINQGNQKPEVVHEAKCLLKDLKKKENVVLSVFWNVILNRINAVNISLQKKDIELLSAVHLLKSLLDFLIAERENFEYYLEKANEIVNTEWADEKKRNLKRKKQYDEGNAKDVVLRGKERFKVETYFPVFDMLSAELLRRLKAYDEIFNLFGFLTNFLDMSDADIKTDAEKFKMYYFEDIESDFAQEIVHFKYFILQLEDFKNEKFMPAAKSYNIIFKNMSQCTFPNVMTALKMYRSLMITNATGERSFSKLKLIKHGLRSSMSEKRLNDLAVMALENDVLQNINFDNVLEDFISKKIRKINL